MKNELKEAEIYKAIFETSLAGFFVVNELGNIKKTNPAGERMFGYGAGELNTKKIEELFSKEDSEYFRNIRNNVGSLSVQVIGLKKDGKTFSADVRIGIIDVGGNIINTVYCKPSDTSVFESDRKLRTLVKNVSGIVYRCKNDRDWSMEFISEGCEPITGYNPQDFMKGKVHFSHIIFQEDQNHVWNTTQEALRKNEPFQFFFRITDKSGVIKYLSEMGRGVFDTNGDLCCLEGFITDITQQKETELLLKREKETLSHYLNAAASIFLIINVDHTIKLINRKGCEILGYSQDEIIGKSWFHNCIPRKEKKELAQLFDQIIDGTIEPPEVYENWVVCKGNKRRLIRWRNALSKDDNGIVTGLISSGIDVTEQVMAEEKLRNVEEKNRAILKALPDLIFVIDKKGTILQVGTPQSKELVLPLGEMIGKNVSDILPPDVSTVIKRRLSKAIRSKKEGNEELIIPIQGKPTVYESRFVPFDTDKVLIIARNISQVKSIQNTLALRNRALEAAGNGILIVDAQNPNLPITYCNKAFLRITGYVLDDVLGVNCKFLQKDDQEQAAIITMAKAIQKGQACHVLVRNYKKDGSLFWNDLTITPLHDENNKLTHFIGVQNDVTELQEVKKQLEEYTDQLEIKVEVRTKEIEATVKKLVEVNLSLEDQIQITKRAENKARHSQEQFTAIAKNFPNGLIVVFNADFELVYVEGEELKRINLKKTDFEGKCVDDIPIFSEAQVARIKEDVLKTIAGKSLSFEIEFQNYAYAVNSTPLTSNGESVVWALFVYNNITEQKNVQVELANALKTAQELNELKSRFISMASHEFRTPLSAILSSAILIGKQNEPGKEERREKHVARIRAHVKHLVVILNDFLSLSKLEEGKVTAKPQRFELIQFCKILVDEMEATKKEGQTITLKYTNVEIHVFLDPKLLSHILINLLSNALKYSGDGEEIGLELAQSNEHILFRITDSGIGIPAQEQEHLFERFFRAENATNIQGTGLGLHIVKQYTELMKGTVNFISNTGKGSTFTVQLPQNLYEHEKNTFN